MRFGVSVHPLHGPFYLSQTLWRSRRRRRPHAQTYHGTLPGWRCPHDHRREDTALECARRERNRRAAG